MSKKRKGIPSGSSARVLNQLHGLAQHTTNTLAAVAGSGDVLMLSDDELTAALTEAGAALRGAEGAVIALTAEVQRRASANPEEPCHRQQGCRNVNELLQRTTGMSGASAKRFTAAAEAVQAPMTMQGELLPPPFPVVTELMRAGHLGVDGVIAATRDLAEVRHRVEPVVFDDVERTLGDAITTLMAVGPALADHVRVLGRELATRADQDGPKPVENEARRGRYVKLGQMRNGLVSIHGRLTPDVAATFRAAYDAMHNPRVTFADPDDDTPMLERDDRTTGQKWHDTFATVVNVAMASKELPTLGGAPAVLVVHVEEETLLSGEGWARIDGDPVPIESALHAGCAGAIQRVAMNRDGRVTRIGTEERIFNRHQRRAIAARDQHCVIPGCTVPAAWCECHHVTPWRYGGMTSTDNGVLLCWYHHRYIDDGVWQLKFIQGVPHVKSNRWGSEWRPTQIRQRT